MFGSGREVDDFGFPRRNADVAGLVCPGRAEGARHVVRLPPRRVIDPVFRRTQERLVLGRVVGRHPCSWVGLHGATKYARWTPCMAVTEALRILQPEDGGDRQLAQLEKEVTRVAGERARLANAIATGGDLEGLLVAMKDRESRLGQLDRQRQTVEAQVARSAVGDVDKVRRELQALSTDWRRLLGQQPVHARTILAKLVVGRVTFTPRSEPKQWELRGRGTIAGLFEAVFPLGMASPTGHSLRYQPVFRGEWVDHRRAA